MSREIVEQVQRGFEAFKEAFTTGEFAAAERFIHPNVEWRVAQDLEPYRGIDGIKAALQSWNEAWEWWTLDAEEYIDAGDSVIIPTLYRGKARDSGLDLEARFYNVCTIRDGRLARMYQYSDRKDALEAVGLRE